MIVENKSSLVYVNRLGVDAKNNQVYELIFSTVPAAAWSDGWIGSHPEPPEEQYISEIGIVKDPYLDLRSFHEIGFFNIFHCQDGVVALAWEDDEMDEELNDKRIVLKYGQNKDEVILLFSSKNIKIRWTEN